MRAVEVELYGFRQLGVLVIGLPGAVGSLTEGVIHREVSAFGRQWVDREFVAQVRVALALLAT